MIKLKIEIEEKDGVMAINLHDNGHDPNRKPHTELEGLVADIFIHTIRVRTNEILNTFRKKGYDVDSDTMGEKS